MPAALSQIRAWSTEHLIDAATYWGATADRWEDAFLQMRNQSHAIAWHGAGGDGLRHRTGADLSVVSAKADQLRRAAGIARTGAGDIGVAQRRVLYAVEDAENAGFTVEEDLSVIDTRAGGTPAERAARQAQAEAFAADIRGRAEQLDGAEVTVAGQLAGAAAGVGNVAVAQDPATNAVPSSAGDRNGIQLVDFKQDGGSQPPPGPGSPQPKPPPNFLDQYKEDLASPGPQSAPPPVPMPSYGHVDPGPQPAPGPMPAYPPPQSFGQCVGGEVKANVGKDMVKQGFKSGLIKAGMGAAVGAGVTPELAGAGALPGAVLGFVGGFAQGLIEAPVEAAAKGALECADVPIPGLPQR